MKQAATSWRHRVVMSARALNRACSMLAASALMWFASPSHADMPVPPNLSGAVGGTLAGSAGTSSGASSYSIPISVPPGTAGRAPSLSLAYSSQGGDSILGYGWSIGGLPSITRCAATRAVDGFPGRVALDANDRYCFNGQRLIVVSGTYGAAAEYRTELESFSRVTSYGSDASKGPDYWKVETKSGETMYFGNTADSYVEAQGSAKPLLWSVSRVEDKQGNYYTYEYTETNATGEHYPTRIRYTGNGAAGLVPYNAVRFEYEAAPRPDPIVGYVAGSKTSITQRLSKISTWIDTAADGSGGTLVNEVRLTYATSPSSGRSLVDTISWCDAAGACLPATRFTWQQHLSTDDNFNASGSGVWGGVSAVYRYGGTVHTVNETMRSVAFVDLDGDGRTDLMRSNEDGTWRVCLSTGTGFNCQNWATPGIPVALERVLTGDFNGDGRTDIVFPNGSNWTVCLSTGTGFNCATWSAVPGPTAVDLTLGVSIDLAVADINGDGRDDIFVRGGKLCQSTGSGFNCGAYTGTGFVDPNKYFYLEPGHGCTIDMPGWKPFIGDFNGDGRVDVLAAKYINTSSGCTWWMPPTIDNTFNLCLSWDTGTSCSLAVSGLGKDTGFVDPPGVTTGDLNGDGLTDFVLQDLQLSTVLKLCFSTGTGVTCSTYTPPATAIHDASYVSNVADIDGDGQPDLLQSSRVCRLKLGTLVCSSWQMPVRGASEAGPMYADFDGDGKMDMAFYNYAAGTWRIALAAGVKPDLLASVTNGLGHVTSFAYKPLSDGSVYVPDTGTAYPQRESRGSQYVVWQMRTDNAVGGTVTTTYRYGGNKQDLLRRGSLGFRWIEATDSATNVTHRTEYAQGFPYTGMVVREIATQANGVELRHVENTFSLMTNPNATAQVAGQAIQFPFVSSTSETTRELNTNNVVRTTATSIPVPGGMDAYGNVLSTSTTITANGETWGTATTTAYNNDTSAWVLGMASSTIVTASGSAAVPSSVTRTVTSTYYPSGLPDVVTIEPNDSTLKLATKHGRDSYGNVTSKTLTWTDPVSGAVKSRTTETNIYETKGRFVQQHKNALNQTEVIDTDARNGLPLSHKDPNLLVTTWQYDGWGRKTREQHPEDATFLTWAYRQCVDSCGYAAQVVVTQHLFDFGSSVPLAPVSVPSEEFYDRLGRNLRVRTWGFDGSAEIHGEKVFASQGWVDHLSRPRLEGATPVWTYYDRDAIGRVKQIRTPNQYGNGFDTTVYDYAGLTLTSTNAKSQKRTDVHNGIGKLASTADDYSKTTSYAYDPFGNLTRTTDPKSNQIKITYDRLGRKTQLIDPNLGTMDYWVDPLGQTWKQRDAKLQVTTFEFDDLGRITRRLEPDLDSRWVYDTATTGIGKLAEAYTWAGGARDYQRLYAYDASGRLSSIRRRLDWDYVEDVSYDSYGRPVFSTYSRYPKGGGSSGVSSTVWHQYNPFGYSLGFRVSAGSLYKTALQVLKQDAEGHILKQQLGNGLLEDKAYNPYTGRFSSLNAGPDNGAGNASGSHQNDTYGYDSLGNLTYRAQLSGVGGSLVQETFDYDRLNRLWTHTLNGTTRTTLYDELGNLTSKTGVGIYNYPTSGAGSVRPQAVSSITGTVAGIANPTFSYDDNGNLANGLNRKYGWTSFDRPRDIGKLSGGVEVERTSFLYDTEHERVRQTISSVSGGVAAAPKTTIWYAGAQEKEYDTQANTTTIRTHLPMGLGFIEEKLSGIVTNPATAGTPKLRYYLEDHLGSVIGIVDDNQVMLQRMSYDPWGRRRNPDGTDDSGAGWGTLKNTQDHSGYTGHETLDQLGLVHMNARLYDPLIGRHTSADPTVPDPANTQSLNRYSYVLNNSLMFTDPTGLSAESEAKRSDGEANPADSEKVRYGFRNCSNGSAAALNGCGSPGSGGTNVAAKTNGSTGANGNSGRDVDKLREKLSQIESKMSEIEKRRYEEKGDTNEYAKLNELRNSTVGKLSEAIRQYRFNTPWAQWTPQDWDEANRDAFLVLGGLGSAIAASKMPTPKVSVCNCCFVAGTLVLTGQGMVPIEKIEVGTLVQSRNEVTGETMLKPVVGLIHNEGRYLYGLTFVDRQGKATRIEASDNHPFWVLGLGWVDSGKLRRGMKIATFNKEALSVANVESLGRTEPTFNLSVADFHTFFAGEHWAYVHNTCCADAARSGEPLVGGGASLENLTPGEARRIQNAATRTGTQITVVGSRASGSAHGLSDWDYVVPEGTSKRTIHSLSSSLPEGHRGLGERRNQDFFRSTVDQNMPHITFFPQ